MTDIQKKLIALNRYGRASRTVTANWSSTDFKQTHDVAKALLKDKFDSMMGVDVEWEMKSSHIVTATKYSMATGRLETYVELPVEGELADALLSDLQAAAAVRAEKEILEERQRALEAEALARVHWVEAAALLELETSEPQRFLI